VYCRKCGVFLEEGDSFCPICGEKTNFFHESDSTFASNLEDHKPKQKNVASKSSIWKKIFVVILIYVLATAVLDLGSESNEEGESISYAGSDYSTSPNALNSYSLTTKEKNIIRCEEIASSYYDTHTYYDDDVFDCDNMAQDVWNMLETEGINAKVMIGNVDRTNALTLEDCNHAWVMAEVSPNTWLAIECTGGYVVYDDDRYYEGFSFDNPKNYRRFLELYNEWLYQYQDYENYRQYYNEIVDVYNNANYYEQMVLESGLIVIGNTLEEKERICLQTEDELLTLVEKG